MNIIDLSGMWSCRLDAAKKGVKEGYYNHLYDDMVELPGTTSQAHLGPVNMKRETGFLTDEYEFSGWAWFSKDIVLDDESTGRPLRLYLERSRVTRVWVDDVEVMAVGQDSLNAPHIYDLTDYVDDAEFRLTIMVSNVDYPTKGGHMTSPDTQTNWNGICGRMELQVCDDEYLKNVRVDADAKTGHISLKMAWESVADTPGSLGLEFKIDTLTLSTETVVREPFVIKCGDTATDTLSAGIILKPGVNERELDFSLGEGVKLWSEYNPVLYELSIYGNEGTFYAKTYFGFRDITTDEHHFYVNGVKTFLRGKHDGMIFPLTGAAPTDVESWVRVFNIAKSYGINHYRFHTCCPPEAAFTAADLVGIYLSPELPFWGTIAAPGEEGYNEEEQEYLIAEGFRMLEVFGNHPSYAFMSLGNELWGSSERLNDILAGYRAVDSRHLYTQGSNNFQFVPCIVDNDDYFVGVRFGDGKLIRGSYAMCDAPQGFVQTDKPSTNHSYDDVFKQFAGGDSSSGEEIEIQYGTGTKKVKANAGGSLVLNKPVVSHEIGQYGVYPDYKEIKKYTGSLKARNLEIFKERLDAAGLTDMANDFFVYSGKLAVACYKLELEAAHRSSMMAGYQILDIQDFSGQGTALVGILDAFMDSKGLITPKEWRGFCSDAVLMAQFEDFVLEAGSTFDAKILLSAYRPSLLDEDSVQVKWSLYERGRISVDYDEVDEILITGGTLEKKITELGVVDFGSISVAMPELILPERLKLVLEITSENIENSYELYVFPKKNSYDIYPADRENVVIAQTVDDAVRALRAGKNTVLFIRTEKEYIEGTYCTDFWNYPMFKGISDWMKKPRPVGTMGLSIDGSSQAFSLFPSENYSTPQWYNIITGARMQILDGAPIVPIVSVIDNVERNHKLGFMWEAKVEDANLLVVARPIGELVATLEGKQLVKSVLCYAATEDFNPLGTLSMAEFRKLV
ncbi:MAG: beta-glucuronidase [Lachnospiraceae bacterium]|nr:beta-glucuronidase [Lachnospiraceae bacterium]